MLNTLKFMLFLAISSELFGTLLEAQNTASRGIVVGRQDNNYDIVLYLNGQPLQANQQTNLAAFQQTTGIVLSNGQRIPPTAQVSNGQLQTIPTPSGTVNLIITVQRSYYGPIYGKR